MNETWFNPLEDGIITSTFGTRINPILNTEEFHNGIDIAAAEGTPIFAVKSGIITDVYTSSTYGNCVKYETEDGYTIMYAHLLESLVDEGQEIKQGDEIALVGSTGLSTGAHLHYTVLKDDEYIDPIELVSFPYSYEVQEELKILQQVKTG